MHHYLKLGFICIALLFTSCAQDRADSIIYGFVFGTSYSIKLAHSVDNIDSLKIQIVNRLALIDQAMSSWNKNSEINNFNNVAVNKWFQLSDDTYQVIKLALEISDLTGGYFDITVSPLVHLWGFKNHDPQIKVPSDNSIKKALQGVGYKNIQLDHVQRSIKKNKPLTIDLASIAKGYAVDAIALLLLELGYSNYLVEIGGEIKASGIRYDGKMWQIAIEKPSYSGSGIQKIIGLTNQAIATSGDYRNFFIIDDKYCTLRPEINTLV